LVVALTVTIETQFVTIDISLLTNAFPPSFIYAKSAGERGAWGTALSCVVKLFLPVVKLFFIVEGAYLWVTKFFLLCNPNKLLTFFK